MAPSFFSKKLLPGLLIAGLGSLVFGLVAVVSAWFYIKQVVQGEVVDVPDLLGLSIEEAERVISGVDLKLKIDADQRIFSSVIEKDMVYLQVPRSGRKIKTGRVVEVTISAGPEIKLIPNLTGETLNFSRTLLKRAGTEPSIISRTPSQLAGTGRVLSQYPEGGQQIGLREGAALLVSDGPMREWFVTPDLLGRDYVVVKDFLERNGFRVVTKYKTTDDELGQIILQQIPKAGYPVNKAQTITVVVNKDF